jgi:hypothetical protein
MRFFFDNCISPRLARAMNALVAPEHEVVHLRAQFAPDTPDIAWIVALAKQGTWIIVSGDLRIRKRPQEREIWRAAKLTTFFMAENYMNVPDWEQVKWMIDKWPLMVDMASRVTPGAAFLVPKKGRVLTAL